MSGAWLYDAAFTPNRAQADVGEMLREHGREMARKGGYRYTIQPGSCVGVAEPLVSGPCASTSDDCG